jgi:hypothetical protein
MGQQQILLVILVTIIIGVATIIALNVLNSGADQANRDAVRQDLSAAASFVQSIWERPQLMGGASRKFTTLDESEILRFLNVPSSDYQVGDSEATNENGTYRLEIENDTALKIIGEPISGPPNMQISVVRDNDTGQWEFTISEVDESESSGGGSGGAQRGTDSQRQGRF